MPAALGKQWPSQIVPETQDTFSKQLAPVYVLEGVVSRAPHVPLVDFPEGQILDSLNLLNKVKRQRTVE